MSQPTPFDRQVSFALYSAENPSEPHSGTELDAEFNAVKVTLDETLANLALIQDDDGAIARGSVGRAQLDSSVSVGFGAPAPWEAGETYDADVSTVFHEAIFYVCNVDHTSGGSFEPAKWDLIADLSAANVIADGSITTAKLNDLAVTAAKLGATSVTTAKLGTASVTSDKIGANAVTSAKLDATVSSALVPAGAVMDFAGTAAPTGWLFAYGQVVAQATYPALFTALSTTYDTGGEGAGNFRLPDLRGRVVAGKDDMGGSSANRLTDANDGVNGDTLGDTGGGETQVLAQANLPNVAFVNSGITVADTRVFRTDTAVLAAGALTAPGAGGITAGGTGKITSEVASGAISISAQGTAASGGTDTAFGVVQPTIILNKIIKAH